MQTIGEFGKAIGIVLGGGVLAGLAAGALTAGRGPAAARGITTAQIAASFSLCFTGGGTNCVVDGDTFWIGGEKVRIADIDAPETHPPRCDHEAELGERATLRLQQLLNAGPVTLTATDRDTDRYGRLLRVVERGGQSLGDRLVDEGLARRWTGRRLPWCDAI
jgi:micrococcal nuclease